MGNGRSAFEKIVTEAMREENAKELLGECVSRPFSRSAKKIPPRIRLIAMGFIAGMTLDQLNERLAAHGLARLYSRSIWEAGLIYAFRRGFRFDQYKEIEKECEEAVSRYRMEDRYFQGGKITVREVREYVAAESDRRGGQLITKQLTSAMDQKLENAASQGLPFSSYIKENLDGFRTVREKSRYYFCKYLTYYMDAVTEQILGYASLEKNARDFKNILDLIEFHLFRGIQEIKRGRLSEAQILARIQESALSFSAIFDAFDEFLCGYVTLDWMDILMEQYEGRLSKTEGGERAVLLHAIRKTHPEWKHFPDADVLQKQEEELLQREADLDAEYARDGTASYQKGRAGENTIRKYLKGTLDIDRTTLACFLLFFSANGNVPKGQEIGIVHLSEMLANAGYHGLDRENDFDYFIMEYLNTDEKMYFLMEEVTKKAMHAQNSAFYRMYRNSRSQEGDVRTYFRNL